MSITPSHIERSSSFHDNTYDYQRIKSFQPFTTEFVDSSMNISNIHEINRIHTLFCLQQQSSSINPNLSFSPLRYFREHCLVKQVSQIRNFSPFQPYDRNKTLVNKKPMGLSGGVSNNKPFIKSHSYIQHKENEFSKLTSVISDKDKYAFNNSEKQTKDSFVNNSCNTENLSTLIKVSTELQNKKEIQNKQKVTYTQSFHPFAGFCAFIYKNQNEKTFDKVDIGINKVISLTKSQTLSSSPKKNDDKTHPTFHSHFFGLFQGKFSSNGANYFKEKYRQTLFQKPNLTTSPITAMFETHREIDSYLKSSLTSNTTIDIVHSCILFTLDNKMYLLSKGNSKCIISLRNSSAVYSLVKVMTSRHMSRREFLQMLGDHSPSPPKVRKGANLQVQNYQYSPESVEVSEINMNNEIDFLLIMNDNISKYLTHKECMVIIYKTLFECQCKDVPYKEMLETVISNICIEATQNNAKNSLSLLFLPQERLKLLYEKGVIVNTQVILQNIMDSPSSNFNSIYPLMKIHEESDGKNTKNCSSVSFESYQRSGSSWTSMDETNLSLTLKKQNKKSRFCCGLFS